MLALDRLECDQTGSRCSQRKELQIAAAEDLSSLSLLESSEEDDGDRGVQVNT